MMANSFFFNPFTTRLARAEATLVQLQLATLSLD